MLRYADTAEQQNIFRRNDSVLRENPLFPNRQDVYRLYEESG